MMCFGPKPNYFSKYNERLLKAYETAIEKWPKQRQKAFRDNVAKVLLADYPLKDSKIIWSGRGNDLFFDSLTHRRFYSSFDCIETAIAKANKRLSKSKSHKVVPLADIFSDWSIKTHDYIKNYGFFEPIKYEIKVVQEGNYVTNVILFKTTPRPIK